MAIPASAQSIAVIQRVLEGSPAGEAGLQAGDLLLSVAGEAGGVTGCGEGGQLRAEGWGRGGQRRPICRRATCCSLWQVCVSGGYDWAGGALGIINLQQYSFTSSCMPFSL